MATPSLPAPKPDNDPGSKIADAILKLVGQIPKSDEAKSRTPAQSAKVIANMRAAKAALAAGSLALPPGPLGWLTILPELVAVWRIQAQMVADIAAIYGKKATLTREQMLYCLFRHITVQLLRDLVARVGERFVFRRMSLRAIEPVARKIGIKITQRAIGKSVSRWLPVIGALGVGAYAYYDTAQVAATAIELFEGDVEFKEDRDPDNLKKA